MKWGRKRRKILHDAGFHEHCRITMEKVVIGTDHSRKFIMVRQPDGTHEALDVTSMMGDPVYSDEEREVHR
jgi:hypothetical protein